MSVSLTKICVPTADLSRMRVRCVKCGAVVEIAASPPAVEKAFHGAYSCPLCKAQFRLQLGASPLAALAEVLGELARDSQSVTVEFLIDPPTP